MGFYKNLFMVEEIIRPELEDIDLDCINAIESDILDVSFTEEEVLLAIKDLGQDKTPGPDGYPLMFFSKCRNFLKADIMGIIQEFWEIGNMYVKHNSTFIALVPKKVHVESIRDCRPICLLTNTYKIVAKVLAT